MASEPINFTEADEMRISFRRLLLGLFASLAGMANFAQAENYLTPVSMSAASSASSYYANSYEEEPAAPAAQSVANCDACDSCISDNCCVGNWRDNTQVWFGADAYKSLGDSVIPPGAGAGFMDSAGVVGGFNTGFRLGQSRVRGQLGASYGVYDFKGRDTVSTSSSEQQTFVTLGLYKRSDVCNDDRVSWGAVYDQFFGHQWGLFAGEVYLSQFRGIAGYALNECNEVGVWGTVHTNNDGSVTGFATPLRAMNQANLYWRHNYEFGGQTMAYIGGVDRADVASWLVGVLGQAPLSNTTSIYSNVTFAFPGSKTGPVGANELEWNLGLGLMYSFGGKAVSQTVSGQQGLPLLPVANNGSLLITN
jgi:hypothetical protein